MLTLTVALLLQAQTTPYLVLPNTHSSSSSSAMSVPVSTPSLKTELEMVRKGVLDLVNQERRKRGLSAMKSNPLLDLSAQRHAQDMLKRKFFSHQNTNGLKPEDRIRAVGYFTPPCNCAVHFAYGENIAKGQKTPTEVMNAWMHSTVHRSNILKSDFKELGIGYAGGVWVQNFGGITIER